MVTGGRFGKDMTAGRRPQDSLFIQKVNFTGNHVERRIGTEEIGDNQNSEASMDSEESGSTANSGIEGDLHFTSARAPPYGEPLFNSSNFKTPLRQLNSSDSPLRCPGAPMKISKIVEKGFKSGNLKRLLRPLNFESVAENLGITA